MQSDRIPTLRRVSAGALSALAACAALTLAGPAAAQAPNYQALEYPRLPEFEIPEPERVVLDNGMVVMLLEDHELPLVDAIALIRTGGRWEPADRLGLAELTGEVLRTGGTAEMNADELDDWLENEAASIESSISTELGMARMSSLAEDFSEVLGVFADVLRRPAFAADRLEVARTRLESEIARQNDQPIGILFREISELVYGEQSPYARNPTYETVGAIGRDDLVAWHRRWYHPDRVILGLVGDFDREQALALVRKEFGDWARGPEVEAPAAGWKQSPSPGIYHVRKGDVTQSNIAMAHLGIRQDDPSYYAVEVMNNVLSGSASSRLFAEVRTRQGLAYAVSGSVGADYDHPGMTLLWMTTKTDSTAAGIDALLAEARGMTARPPTDEEVAKAKEAILNSFVFNFDSPAKILRQQLTYEYYGYPLDRMERYRAGIEAVTAEQVRRAAAEYLHPDQFAILVVGPSEGLDRPLSEFGEVQVVDVTIPEPAAPEMEAGAEELARGAELIGRAVEAMGGAEAVDGVRALEMEMTMEMPGPGGSMDVPLRVVIAPPDRMRQEMSFPFGDTVVALDGEGNGWMKSPRGVDGLPDSQLQELRRALERNAVVLLQARDEPGFSAAAIGSGEVAGTAVEQVRVRHDDLDAVLEIDDSGRILAIGYRGPGQGGAPAEIELRFSDFRDVDGLSMPFAAERIVDGERLGGGTMQNARVNPEIDPSEFARPESGDNAPAGER